MYDLSTGKLQLEFESNELENNREGYKCTFTHQGTHFALTTTKSFTLWDLKTGLCQKKLLNSHEKFVVTVSMSPKCKMLASGSNDLTIKIWDCS